MLLDQLMLDLQSSLKAKGVDANFRKKNELLVPMEYLPMVYPEISAFEETAGKRRIKIKKSIELVAGKEYEVIEAEL